MRTTFSTHKGVRVCVLDFSNITSEAEALRAIDEAGTIIRKEPPASVHTLTDVYRRVGQKLMPRYLCPRVHVFHPPRFDFGIGVHLPSGASV